MSSKTEKTPSKQTRPAIRWLGFSAILILLGAGVWGGWVMLIRGFDQACRVAQTEHRWSDLEMTSRRWSRFAPYSVEPWVFLADAVQHQDRFVEAAEFLAQIPPDSPQYLPSQLGRAKILFGPANRPFVGEAVCRQILEIEPKIGGAHELLIQFYTVTLQRTKLRDQIISAIRVGREPRDAYVYYFLIDSLRLGEGVSINALWLDSYPDNEVLLVAEMLHSDDSPNSNPAAQLEANDSIFTLKGKTPDTTKRESLTLKERQARELLERFPHNANLLAYLADQELSKGNVDQVIELLKQTQPDTEADPRFWRFKGWVHFTRKEYAEAEQAYRKALSIHPLDWLTIHRLAEILRISGNTDEVTRLEKLVDRAHQLRPRIRDLKSVLDSPIPLLKEIGSLARDAGDTVIAEALTRRLGSLD